MIPASDAATGENVPFAGGGGIWLRFTNASNSYVAYSGIGRWGPKGETMTKDGLVVEQKGKLIANLKCMGESSGVLSPDWLNKVGITTKGSDFTFPE